MDKVKIGLLGCGGIAGGHARKIQESSDSELVALCDVSDEVIDGFTNRVFGEGVDIPRFTDPAAMYSANGMDAVVIATPHTLHYAHAVQALEADCHVFMEKPMVTEAGHAYDLARKVDESGKILTVGFNTSCTPAFDYLRGKIRSGAFGKLELVNGFLCQNWLKATAGKWRQEPALSGGGQAYDSGAHIINSLVWSVESRPAEVFAFVDNCGSKVDINSAIAIRFENGVMATLSIGGNCLKAGQHMSFIFENARVEVDGWCGSWIKVYADGEPETPDFGQVDGSPLRNFIDAVLGKTEAKTSPRNGIHHTELMDAIYESARTGQPARPKA